MDEKQHGTTDVRTSEQPAAVKQTVDHETSNDNTSVVMGGISSTSHNTRPETPTRATRGRYHRGRGGGRGFPARKGNLNFPYFYRKRPGQQQENDNDRRILPSDGSDQSEQKSRPPKKSNGRKRFQRRPERREKQHKWKPYHLLSWEEKKELEERETKRAEQRRNQLTTLGFPQAPYNTTQFLMEDHKSEHDKMFADEGGFASSEESSPAEDDISLDRGYAQELARVLVADLNAWSKDRLISHILQMEHEKSVLERRIRSLEKEVERLTPKMDGEEPSTDGTIGFMEGVMDHMEEPV